MFCPAQTESQILLLINKTPPHGNYVYEVYVRVLV